MTASSSHRPTIAVTRHAIAAGHYLAATAGFDILQAGGNAIDAGCAAGIALGVLQSDLVDFAGVAPIMIYLADKARGRDDRRARPLAEGARPRTLHARARRQDPGGRVAHRRAGGARRVDHGAEALRHDELWRGRRGGDPARARRLPDVPADGREPRKGTADRRAWPSTAAVFLPNGRPPETGEMFRQTDLAASLQYMADEEKAAASRGREAGLEAARDAFYRGDIARKIVAFIKERGRPAVGRRPGGLPFAGRPARAPPLRRSRSLHLRRVVPGAGPAADLGAARRHRSRRPRPQQRRLHPHADRGAEARLRRPRGLLHRPGHGQGAAARP